eukprot:CAMPEP_0185503060 /NCGR_PEP_ID=MMETSP1366-20130426/30497_1 /TAXON_ID=38817 /ORGANISM="Gephyrocapsa oceanica, Strain RCC1303" /LENGTH=43 /DNA_ID= /DNA_START= /DNA_END= /DNA_ORIENTATION=
MSAPEEIGGAGGECIGHLPASVYVRGAAAVAKGDRIGHGVMTL